MDGATAWLLINRHASGWEAVGEMMDAWLSANAEQPPSAPVGVDGGAMRKALANLVRAGKRFRNTVVETRGVIGMDEHDLALSAAETALAQQPAAVDEAMVERALDAVFPPTFKRNDALRDMWRTGLTAALAAQQGGES